MSREETAAIIRKTEGRLCGRLYLRGDRTATFRDCRGGQARKRIKLALTVGTFLLLAATTWIFRSQGKLDRTTIPPLVKQALDWIDPEPRNAGSYIVGALCPAPRQNPPLPQSPGSSPNSVN